jgi:hypothetical protein
MNENEFDRAARAWLDEGPTRMSDRALLSALEEIHTTRQRRALRPAWSATPVSTFARVGMAAVLVAAVGLMAINAVPRQPDGPNVGGASPSPTPAQVEFPDLTKTFVSKRNGFSVKHPDRAVLTPANAMDGWDPGDEQSEHGIDVVDTRADAVFKGASIKAPEWEGSIDGFVDDITPGGCGATRSQQAEITIDRRSGWIAECPNEIDTIVVAGGRLYLFTLQHQRRDGRAVFDAIAATIDLTPETAADQYDVPTWVAVLQGMTKTFVSPTYGYSFKYYRGVTPATEVWDPGNQPLDDIDFDRRFDANETGAGAYFEAASTPIPDGVSIDEWVDQYVTPRSAGRCGVPRSRQADITIDGHLGRIAVCPGDPDTDPREAIDTGTPGKIDATVVAGGRLYLFSLGGPSGEGARMLFDAWVATIDLRPEDAAVPSRTPSS